MSQSDSIGPADRTTKSIDAFDDLVGRQIRILAVAVAALAVVVASLAGLGGCSPSGAKSVPEIPRYVASIKQLDDSYERNEVATDQALKGKLIEVSGTVRKIEKNAVGEAYVSFTELLAATATFSRGHDAEAASLVAGQSVKLLCEHSIFVLGSTQLDDCVLAK